MQFTHKQFLNLIAMSMASMASPMREIVDTQVTASTIRDARASMDPSEAPPTSARETQLYDTLDGIARKIETKRTLNRLDFQN